MRQLLFGLCGTLALGFVAVTAQPASAQPSDPGIRQDHSLVQTVQYYGPPRYAPPRYYRGYGYGRPYYRHRGPGWDRRCFVRRDRVWNGYRWVWRSVRVCR